VDAEAAPGIATIDLGAPHDSAEIGKQLSQAGFLVSYNSDYLRRRNWIQICLMGEFAEEKLESLITRLREDCGLKDRPGEAPNGLVKNGAFAQKATARTSIA
jgi:hypothetical protein